MLAHKLIVYTSLEQALDRPYAYVVLATKAVPEVISTPAIVAPLLHPAYAELHPQPAYVFMQNGIGVEDDLYTTLIRKFPSQEPRLIGVALWIGIQMVDGNAIEYRNFVGLSCLLIKYQG